MDFSSDDFSMDDNKEDQDSDNPFAGEFKTNALEVAKVGIRRFFKDKKFHSGGEIPKNLLNQERYLDFVLYIGIADATTAVFRAIDNSSVSFAEEDGFSESSHLVHSTLTECCLAGIPKCFAGGVLIMYVELCEGIRIGI